MSNQGFSSKSATFSKVLDSSIEFGVALKVLPSEGNLVYEYNPLRNYRVQQTSYRYNNKLLSAKELLIELKQIEEDSTLTEEECLKKIESFGKDWSKVVSSNIEDPVLIEAGELTDFETNELSFDLNHPVDILPQYSYDDSVNLILNDGKNVPRLINSRFSAKGKNQYQIVDRKGDNDTNIYDQGSQFDIDTSLYKRVVEIPKLRFIGASSGGHLPVGNYHFYFKYSDADGNETDFVAESGLVSLFIGNDPCSVRTGFREEDSHKSVQFLLTNIDSAYQYVVVYYTKSTSDIQENAVVTAKRIEQKFLVNNFLKCNVVITGYEESIEVTTSDINPMYQIADSVQTQEQCQNMLFLGNIEKPEIPYSDLEDLSLRFLPYLDEDTNYNIEIDQEYTISTNTMGYYDPKFIYNNVGYWNHELYRLGIVYIMSNNSLSPVFNIRGINNLSKDTKYSEIPMYYTLDGVKYRNHIITEEDTYKIVSDPSAYKTEFEESTVSSDLENAKGVISLNGAASDKQKIFGISIQVKQEVLDYIKDTLKIKGFFFVRQKRIPTILCQAYTIGIDLESRTPVLPTGKDVFISERFMDDDQILTHDFEKRLYKIENSSKVRKQAAICPEYDVDYPYFNSLFTGDKLVVTESDTQPSNPFLERDDRNFYINSWTNSSNINQYIVKIIGVEDNTKLVAINNYMFSARAGEAEEAFRFEYIEKENKTEEASNLLRGSFGPYLGITGYPYTGKMVDIRIPGFNTTSTQDLFKIRYNDKAPFYAISDRIALNALDDWFDGDNTQEIRTLSTPLHRGDCYICQFTHRVNRNFQDPSAPTNDKIVDKDCWADNYEVNDGVMDKTKFEDINLGDVNAIKLGMWVTLTVRSTKNLNIRSLDSSIPDEEALVGHSRGFFPLQPMTPEGSYKTPEALCYNKGFEKSVSERYNMEVPDIPAIKNCFTTRISYSDIHVNDAFKNGFRVFQGTHFRDYPKTYGALTKLVELRGALLCVFEHGIALVSVNERAVAGEGSGGNIYINTSNVLPENPKVISDTFGSQWKESIIKTPVGVYGVDTVGKKIWRTNGDTFECISDFKIQEFLNQNISLTERELDPIIGVRNVKTHYNKFKHDVMFTFYDNLYGFEEKVWNICYNESAQKWITFYSWIPSYSANIYNEYFSFNRNTSKWIAKLGVSHADNDFSDGVVLSNNEIPNIAKSGYEIGELSLANRTLPTGTGITVNITYSLEHDNFKNYEKFEIKSKNNKQYLYLKTDASNLCSEFYVRGTKSNGEYIQRITNPTTQSSEWLNNCVYNNTYCICKDELGRRINLSTEPDLRINSSTIVYLLNIRAHIKVTYDEAVADLAEAYAQGFSNGVEVDAGYYQSVVAVIPEYNKQFLSTDFWKHGQAGIIDIADDIYPCYWYGKQHPFEFEFVVADNSGAHKIFDNLEIISNNAEPESFHYEIIGDCYDFAKDKKNMYIRQEATKELYQYNGSDIVFNSDYNNLNSEHRKNYKIEKGKKIELQGYDRSTLLPLYYQRADTINEIEDSYKQMTAPSKDYSALSGGEIVKYDTLDEYRIWNHAKAIDISDPEKGRLRGNMHYKEDKWYVQINPLNIVQKNESEWTNMQGNNTNRVPVELGQNPLPSDILNPSKMDVPDSFDVGQGRGYTTWSWKDSNIRETKIKDKWIKIRIRYTGNKLAVISAVSTLYSISYS